MQLKVLSEALLKRLTDPKAVTCTPKELLGGTADASLAIMAGCFSTLVDLHSSDDPAYLQVVTIDPHRFFDF